jgi:hypothetical protein
MHVMPARHASDRTSPGATALGGWPTITGFFSRKVQMARSLKSKKLARITVTRIGDDYQLQIEDEAGKTVRLDATSDQVLSLADTLDDLLAEEEMEQRAEA